MGAPAFFFWEPGQRVGGYCSGLLFRFRVRGRYEVDLYKLQENNKRRTGRVRYFDSRSDGRRRSYGTNSIDNPLGQCSP